MILLPHSMSSGNSHHLWAQGLPEEAVTMWNGGLRGWGSRGWWGGNRSIGIWCVLHKWVPLLEPSKVYLNAAMGVWGLTGMYERVPGFVLNLIQHTWFKDLNSKAWGLKPIQAVVSGFSRLMANHSADCLFWTWTFDSDHCFKRGREENVQEIKW